MPRIACGPDTTVFTQTALCTNTFDPGVPVLLEGGLPITWEWELTGATVNPGSSNIDAVPTPIGDITFELGVTTITWIASNASDADTCWHTVEVVDTVAPVILLLDPLEECVEPITSAVYFAPTVDIQPDRPDFYHFRAGDNLLDIDLPDYTDNCDLTVCTPEVRWRIDFSDGTMLPAGPLGYITGQPSAYGSDILFPGDELHMSGLVHTITYWIVDCNGNVSAPYTRFFTVMPRPNIIKMN